MARGAAVFTALLVCAAAPLLLLASPAAAEPRVSATLSPPSIALGSTARLTITVSGAPSSAAPGIPPIDGLAVGGLGQQTRMQIVDGRSSVEVTYGFALQPQRAGRFRIPPLQIEVDGQRLGTPELTLEVVAPAPGGPPQGGAGAAVPPPSSGARRGATRPPGAAGPGAAPPAGAADQGPPAHELATLEIVLPRRALYVGEQVAATLRLWIREDLRVTDASQPTLSGGAFSMTRDAQHGPEQSSTTLDGARYQVVSFPVALSPATAGRHPLEARIDLQAILPPTRGQQRRGVFDDPFFDSFFGGLGGGRPQKVAVGSKPLEIDVLSLPEAGRPADFSGSIGRFSIAAAAQPTELAVGDPLSATVTIDGQGNFDRVAVPPLASDEQWKTYAPTARFEPSDALGLAGRKVFEQAVIPLRADAGALPVRRFTYFDPEERRYVSLATQPIALRLAAGQAGSGQPAGSAQQTGSGPAMGGPRASAPATAASAGAGAPTGAAAGGPNVGSTAAAGAAALGSAGDTSGFEIAPNQISLGPLRRDATPLAERPWFLATQLLALACLGTGLLWLRRHERRSNDPDRRRERAARRRIRGEIEAMSVAVRSDDVAGFFAAARRAVQEQVAAGSGGSAGALTLAEIEARLTGEHAAAAAGRAAAGPAGGELLDEIRALLGAADAAAYSGSATGQTPLDQWQRRTVELLRRLGARP